MKCTLCLGLVGEQYPSELELPVISSVGPGSLIFSTFCNFSGGFMSVLKKCSTLAYILYFTKDHYRNGIQNEV